GKVDARCDLFSLGVVLYQLSTGVRAFQRDQPMATLLAVRDHHPEPPRQRNPSISPELSALILRLLAKRPEDRPASAQAVVRELRALETPAIEPAPRRVGPSAGTESRPVGRSVTHGSRVGWRLAGAAGIMLCAVAGALVLSWYLSKPTETPPRPTEWVEGKPL